jgi:hypothetical protein
LRTPTCVLSLCLWAAGALSTLPADAALRSVPKPNDNPTEHRARQQPTVPGTYTDVPFVEPAPAPELTEAERSRGFLLFQRPIMDPVHPNTHPLPHERLKRLSAFATPSEFEPVTFSVYPIRDLRSFRVKASALKGNAGEIPESRVSVRLATYWNVGYPRYTSRTTYRRVPELLERVTHHSSPADECQRWWLTVAVPPTASAGLYHGTVTVWDAETADALEIPLVLRVLPFTLKADPGKHYSVYYALRNKVQFKGRDDAFVDRALGNEYRAMADLGLDACPTLYLRVEGNPGKIAISHVDQFERMLAAGLKGPIPLAGGNAISHIYSKTTPGGKRGSHWKISKMPTEAFYAEVTRMFKALEAERRARGWPELICCPLDEVTASQKEFGSRVYKAVRDAGIRTYITKNPLASDAADYHPGIDVWCSQPYSMPYEKITAQDRYEYWCYPNHNAGEVKDRRVMCKGGRMTYGFGFWRSGYTTLIPWHWAWTPGDDQFDYLRGRRSGCGQRIDDDGEVIEAVYWQCFREGRDDARYVYTLQQAIWERQNSTDADCQSLVANGKALLQETWHDITVQQKYLADSMWASSEFNARRWRLALAIQALLPHPPTRRGTAPSVLVTDTSPRAAGSDQSFISTALERGQLEARDLGGDFSKWVNVTGEGALTVAPEAGEDGVPGLRWEVQVDHKTDGGGEGGDYPIGWPRVYRPFAENELDMARYEYLLFRMKIDSDRDEVADDTTPVGFTVHSNKFYEVSRDLGGRQRVWLPVLFPIESLIASVGQGEAPWHSIQKVQFFISERGYTHGTKLTFDVSQVKLLRFKSPMIRGIAAPASVLLPTEALPVSVNVMGTRAVTPGSHDLLVSLLDEKGTPHVTAKQDLSAGGDLQLDLSKLPSAAYVLRAAIRTTQGTRCSQVEREIECVPGPFLED